MNKYLLKEVMLFNLHKFTGRVTYNCSKKCNVVYCISSCSTCREICLTTGIKVQCAVCCKQSFLMPSGICIQCKKAYFLEVKYQYISMFYCFLGTASYKAS